ncbi:hypothetical protein ATN37_01090 [Rhodococcus sp. MH15]|nr:hypothetical protein [Rhodococcus sp. MH15]
MNNQFNLGGGERQTMMLVPAMLPAPARQVSALVRNQLRCCSTPRHSTGEVARMPVFADDPQ